MENEIVKPIKTYIVRSWEIRLKSGAVATYNIREDQKEEFLTYTDEHGTLWWKWVWPAQHRSSRIKAEDIAAEDYTWSEMKEIKLYKPKKGAALAEGKDDTNGNR